MLQETNQSQPGLQRGPDMLQTQGRACKGTCAQTTSILLNPVQLDCNPAGQAGPLQLFALNKHIHGFSPNRLSCGMAADVAARAGVTWELLCQFKNKGTLS